MNELDELMDKIQLLFLNHTSIQEEHNGQYIKHQDFLDEVKKLLKERFYSKTAFINRYNITPIIEDNVMTGIEYQNDSNGNWVNYNDIRNLIEDKQTALIGLEKIISVLLEKHRNNTTGI